MATTNKFMLDAGYQCTLTTEITQNQRNNTLQYTVSLKNVFEMTTDCNAHISVYTKAEGETSWVRRSYFSILDCGKDSSNKYSSFGGSSSGSVTVTRDLETNTKEIYVRVKADGDIEYKGPLSLEDTYSSVTLDTDEYFTFTAVSKTPVGVGANITAATDFTDEQDPAIEYYYDRSPLLSSYSLQARIALSDEEDDLAFETLDVNETTHTFNLTDADRTKLRNKLDTATSTTVKFYLRTIENYADGTSATIDKYVTRTLTFVNYLPTLNPSIKDVNSSTVALTGDDSKIIRGYSNAQINTNAVAKKGATISYIKTTNGALTQQDTELSPVFNSVPSDTFNVVVCDSRGHTASQVVVLSEDNFINYTDLSCLAKVTPTTPAGEVTVSLSGKYFGGSFGASNNAMTCSYTLSKNGGTPTSTSLGTITPTWDSDTYNYSYSFNISELDYKSTYTITVTVKDKIDTVGAQSTVTVVAVPIFAWDKDEFEFNVPVKFKKNFETQDGLRTVVGEPRTINITGADSYYHIGSTVPLGLATRTVYSLSAVLKIQSNTYVLPYHDSTKDISIMIDGAGNIKIITSNNLGSCTARFVIQYI